MICCLAALQIVPVLNEHLEKNSMKEREVIFMVSVVGYLQCDNLSLTASVGIAAQGWDGGVCSVT